MKVKNGDIIHHWYCSYNDAVVSVLKTYTKGSPYFNRNFAEALRDLSNLLASDAGIKP